MLPLRDTLPTRRAPVVTWALIALNVVAFLWEYATVVAEESPRIIVEHGLVPARLLTAPLAEADNLLTSMFLHSPEGWWHLGGNMLFLWIFGDNVEDALGRTRYLAFYLASGIAAALAQVLTDPGSVVPMVGASGAIAGVVAAYGSLYPRAPIAVLNPIPPLWLFFGPFFYLPAWVIILEFFGMNLYYGLATLGSQSGGVAFFAHLGGFVAGLVLVRWLLPRDEVARRNATDPWDGWEPPSRIRVERMDPWRYPRSSGRGRRRW
jgi:membrane associated rhomboid family serine protease